MKVLVTGGTGYIGSHTVCELNKLGHHSYIIDNLSNSSPDVLKTITELTGKNVDFFQVDLRDSATLNEVVSMVKPQVILHFAGVKSVSESVEYPNFYYDVNVAGTINLLQAMSKSGCSNIIFSSSATVYGSPKYLPYDEEHALNPSNPYGSTKVFSENIMRDWAQALTGRKALALRYFNPIGADPSGKLRENPLGTPNNLMPHITNVATGKAPNVKIFGADYETRDGTGERDYVHVSDLALAHAKAVTLINSLPAFMALNLGTGRGHTVKEVISTFEFISGKTLALEISGRRAGDIARSWADPSLAQKVLNFKFERTLEQMCVDTWNSVRGLD